MRDLVVLIGFVGVSQMPAHGLDAQPGPTSHQLAGGASKTTAASVARAFAMPPVVGLAVDSAMKLLAGSRVKITQRDSSTNASPPNQVIAQEPRPGTPLSQIRQIVLVVAVPVSKVSTSGALRAPVLHGVIAPPNSVSRRPPPPPPQPSPVTFVPQLVTHNARDVLPLLTRARLHLDGRSAIEYSSIADSGFVFQQSPLAKTKVDTGSFVQIWISRGPRPVPATARTPNVIGLMLDSAGRTLRNVKLIAGHVDTIFASDGRGLVVHQLPEPLALSHPGDAVALRISVSPPLVAVPHLKGLHRAAARDSLRAAGLALGNVIPVTGHGRDTVIVNATPSEGTRVPRGTFVDVDENVPVVPRQTIVPSLEGMTRDSAARRLESDSLVLGHVVVSDSGSGRVVATQQPKYGDTVFIGASVSVTLATPGNTPPIKDTVTLIAVPDVENMPLELARRVIDSLGLSAVSIRDSAGKSFVVDSQDPRRGALVPIKATVKLFVKEVSTRSVPHLVGLRRAAAESHAHEDGYTMDVQQQHRVVLQLFEQVATQEPDTQTISRGDQFIRVDTSIPFIPPPLSAAILVLAVGGPAVKVLKGRGKKDKEKSDEETRNTVHTRPLTDLDISFTFSKPTPPVISLVRDKQLIRSAVTFTLEVERGEWIVEQSDKSLIAHQHS